MPASSLAVKIPCCNSMFISAIGRCHFLANGSSCIPQLSGWYVQYLAYVWRAANDVSTHDDNHSPALAALLQFFLPC